MILVYGIKSTVKNNTLVQYNGGNRVEAEELKKLMDLEDVSQIVYRNDDFELDETNVVRYRHIDVEYDYGEYAEIPEEDEMFKRLQEIFRISDLEKNEIVLYKA